MTSARNDGESKGAGGPTRPPPFIFLVLLFVLFLLFSFCASFSFFLSSPPSSLTAACRRYIRRTRTFHRVQLPFLNVLVGAVLWAGIRYTHSSLVQPQDSHSKRVHGEPRGLDSSRWSSTQVNSHAGSNLEGMVGCRKTSLTVAHPPTQCREMPLDELPQELCLLWVVILPCADGHEPLGS